MPSFDPVRERVAPSEYRGVGAAGEISGVIDGPTIVLAVKPGCYGCQAILDSAPHDFPGLAAIVATREELGTWSTSAHEVVYSPSLLDALAVRWAPFYVVVDTPGRTVVAEGLVYDLDQLRTDIAPWLVSQP